MSRLVLCGEGPSDFGLEGEYGPLALVVLKTLEYLATQEKVEYKIPETRRLYHRELAPARIKDGNSPIKKKMSYGRKEHVSLRDKAASFAKNHVDQGDIGVFHSDVDFTNHSDRDKCRTSVINDIRKGFLQSHKSHCCCAIVTMPRTEAWLLYLAPEKEFSPERIEKLPGNDKSPLAPKAILHDMGYVTDNCHSRRKRNRTLGSIVEDFFNYDKMYRLPAYKQFFDAFASIDWKTLL